MNQQPVKTFKGKKITSEKRGNILATLELHKDGSADINNCLSEHLCLSSAETILMLIAMRKSIEEECQYAGQGEDILLDDAISLSLAYDPKWARNQAVQLKRSLLMPTLKNPLWIVTTKNGTAHMPNVLVREILKKQT